MPAENLKQSQLSQADDITIGNSHYLTGYVGTANFRISWLNIKKAILGVVGGVARTIGVNSSGSIVTTDAAQTISNKTIQWTSGTANGKTISAVNLGCLDGASENLQAGLAALEDSILDIASQVGSSDYPMIIDGNSAQIIQNKVYENPVLEITDSGALNCTIDGEIKFLNGLNANIMSLLNNRVLRYGYSEPVLPCYSLAFTASGTSKTINATDIITAFGLDATPANACLSPNHFFAQVMEINPSTYARTMVASTISFTTSVNGSGSDRKINVITLTGLTDTKTYFVNILVKPIAVIPST